MSTITIAQSAIEGAVRRATEWLGEQIVDLPVFSSLHDLTEAIASNERQLAGLHDRLIVLRDAGAAKPADFTAYNVARTNMYRMHQRFRQVLGAVFARNPEALRDLPPLVYAPAVTPVEGPRTVVVSGMRGLGAGPAAAAAIPAWMMGAIVLVILASLVLAIAIVISGITAEETMRDVLVTREQLRATQTAWDARLQVYNECRAAGRTPIECSAAAQGAIPMPAIVARELPRTTDWVKWATIGVGIVAVSGFAIWGIYKWRSRSSRYDNYALDGAPKYRQLSAQEFIEGDGGDYAMEDT